MISASMVCWCLIDGVLITETNVIRKKGRTEGRADKKYRSRQILLGLSWKPRWIASSPPHTPATTRTRSNPSAFLLPARQTALRTPLRERPGKVRAWYSYSTRGNFSALRSPASSNRREDRVVDADPSLLQGLQSSNTTVCNDRRHASELIMACTD